MGEHDNGVEAAALVLSQWALRDEMREAGVATTRANFEAEARHQAGKFREIAREAVEAYLRTTADQLKDIRP